MKEKLKNILPKSEFAKNVLTLMTGSGIAQVIPVLASFILSRLYSPSEFGVLALYTGVIAILGNIGAFRYETAIVLPKKNIVGKYLFILSLLLLSIMLVCYLVVGIIFDEFFLELILKKVESVGWRYFIIPGIFLYTLYQILNFWTNRKKRYVDLAKSRVMQSGGNAFISIILVFLGFTNFGLVLGNIGGQLVTNIYLLFRLKKFDLPFLEKFSLQKTKVVAKKYIQFPLFATPSTVFNTISTMGLPMVIAMFYGAKVAGLYFFAMRMVRLPLDLMFSSFAQVYREQAAQYFHKNKYQLLIFTKKIQLRLILVMLPSLLVLSVVSPYLFKFVFGEQWIEAGEYVRYFAIFLLLSGIYSPISSIGDVLMEQKAVLIFNIVLSTSQVGLFYFMYNYFEFKTVILVVSFCGGGLYLVLDLYMKSVIKRMLK